MAELPVALAELVETGSIRLEAFTNTLAGNQTAPTASRIPAPGPIMNPITPSVSITAVGGQVVDGLPQGAFGVIDITLPVPGPTTIDFSNNGCFRWEQNVELTVKPQVGGAPFTVNASLNNCSQAGACDETVSVNLPSGSFFIEARATFQTL